MRSISLTLAIVTACGGGDAPAGHELAKLQASATSLFVVEDELIVLMRDPELINQWQTDKTMRNVVIAVALKSGATREIARPPVGELYATKHGIVYATIDGQIVLLSDSGTRKIAEVKAVGPVLTRDAVFAVADDPDDDKVVAGPIRIDLQTGAITRLNPTFSTVVVSVSASVDDAGIYYATLDGETLHISGDRVEKIEGPSGWVSCFAVGQQRFWWIQRDPTPLSADTSKETQRPFRIMWMPRAGGNVTKAAEVSGANANCASSGDGLVFSIDERLMSVKPDSTPRLLARARGPIGALATGNGAAFWTEPADSRTPVTQWSVRTLPLH